MAKRILAAMAGIGILMGLAYYSGSLTSEPGLGTGAGQTSGAD